MLANTLMILASDGTKLHGMHYRANEFTQRIVIHVHGMAGNFYENSFIEIIASKCNEKGIDFLTFNNRGHDYIADCEKITSKGSESYNAGGAYEKIGECVYDLKGVIQWAIDAGYTSIYLEGHSSGANKIVFSYDELRKEKTFINKVKGIILISPCDDIGIYHNETNISERQKSFALANKYIDEGNGKCLMPLGTFFDYFLSADTFVDSFSEGSALDMFPYRKGNLFGTKINNIPLPMLIQFGNNGEFVLQDLKDIEKMYLEIGKNNFKMQVINNAGHSYKNHENELAMNIIQWIKGIEK